MPKKRYPDVEKAVKDIMKQNNLLDGPRGLSTWTLKII